MPTVLTVRPGPLLVTAAEVSPVVVVVVIVAPLGKGEYVNRPIPSE
jgi:hypothetical protein